MTCTCNKIGYVSRKQAREETRHTSGRRKVYACPSVEGLWHTTSMTPRAIRALKKRRATHGG